MKQQEAIITVAKEHTYQHNKQMQEDNKKINKNFSSLSALCVCSNKTMKAQRALWGVLCDPHSEEPYLWKKQWVIFLRIEGWHLYLSPLGRHKTNLHTAELYTWHWQHVGAHTDAHKHTHMHKQLWNNS